MNQQLEEISQISIYLQDEQERVNEIALFHPLAPKTAFDETSKPIHQRKWSYTHNLPWLRRLGLKLQGFLYKKVPFLVPRTRLSGEAKFKTVLALLLAQEPLREFFFATSKRRENFFAAAKAAAKKVGFEAFQPPEGENPFKISRSLTQIAGARHSLIDDLPELNLQMAALSACERNEMLFQILNHVERPPITSILEVMRGEKREEIALTTHYERYQVEKIDRDGHVQYRYAPDYSTASIRTQANLVPGAQGAINQRYSIDSISGSWIGSYCGELSSKHHLLEQILLMLGGKGEKVQLLDEAEEAEEQTLLFTSLFSWHEIGLITDQQSALRTLNRKVLRINERAIRLNLLHYNIAFNAFNKFPTPREIGATIVDLNDEALIAICTRFGLENVQLAALHARVEANVHEHDFLKHQEQLLETIDAFRALKPTLIEQCGSHPLATLLRGKLPDGGKLQGVDLLLYLNVVAQELGFLQNKNCQNGTDRVAGGNASDKAQRAFETIEGAPFLPGEAEERQVALFSVLYSMYLVWEEPEINAALSTGFIGEKFYHNFVQKNPETTHYLIDWLKKHPEMYLGLSNQR